MLSVSAQLSVRIVKRFKNMSIEARIIGSHSNLIGTVDFHRSSRGRASRLSCCEGGALSHGLGIAGSIAVALRVYWRRRRGRRAHDWRSAAVEAVHSPLRWLGRGFVRVWRCGRGSMRKSAVGW